MNTQWLEQMENKAKLSAGVSDGSPAGETFDVYIDWPAVEAAPRFAGGHEEVMRAIFGNVADVIAWYHSGEYQGEIAVAYRFKDTGAVLVITDYYGSCSGCDAWENSSGAEAITMVQGLVHNARVFRSVKAAADWCSSLHVDEKPWEYPWMAAAGLVNQLRELETRESGGK